MVGVGGNKRVGLVVAGGMVVWMGCSDMLIRVLAIW
jgi:hypothetical protein